MPKRFLLIVVLVFAAFAAALSQDKPFMLQTGFHRRTGFKRVAARNNGFFRSTAY